MEIELYDFNIKCLTMVNCNPAGVVRGQLLYKCKCGGVTRWGDKSKHFKNTKHNSWLDTQIKFDTVK